MNTKCFSAWLLFFAMFSLSQVSFATAPDKEEEKVIIEASRQKVAFFLNKKKEINAKVSVSLSVVSKTSSSYTFSRSIFFDDNTKVKKIEKKAGRRTIKVEPIITDYESDGIFHSDLKMCFFEHNFTEEGEKIVINYEKVYTDLKFLDPMYFNDFYEIDNSTVIVEVPEWLDLDIREWNFDKEKPDLKKSSEKGKKLLTYTMTDVEGAFRFKGAPRRNKVNAHLILIPTAYKKDGKSKRLMKDVSDLYGWYASLVQQIGNRNDDLKKIVSDLTAGKTDDLKKIKAIFYWVQDNIRYIAFENGIMGFKPESCQKVYNNKYGDCKGMANLTKEMLVIAGYDARLTWLGTNDLPYDYNIPSLVVDNHMICTVILNDEKIFLDATEKYAELYNYAYRIQGKQVLIENGKDYIVETVPVMDNKKSKEHTENTFSIVDKQLKGTGSVTFTGNRKTWIFYGLSSVPESDWDKVIKNYISNYDKNVKLELLTQPNLDNRDADFKVAYDITLDNHIIDLGNELYVNPETDYQFQKYDMPDDRTAGYELPGTYFVETETTMEIPDGWSVKYLPEALNVQHDKYSFSLAYKSETGKVNYHKKIEIKDNLLTTDDFEDWNKAIEKLNVFYSDQIILEKK